MSERFIYVKNEDSDEGDEIKRSLRSGEWRKNANLDGFINLNDTRDFHEGAANMFAFIDSGNRNGVIKCYETEVNPALQKIFELLDKEENFLAKAIYNLGSIENRTNEQDLELLKLNEKIESIRVAKTDYEADKEELSKRYQTAIKQNNN